MKKILLTKIPYFCFSISLISCQIDRICKSPSAGELNNVVDAVFSGGKLYVLSSPIDVLTWCSAFVSVFVKNEYGSFTFKNNITLSGNIATYISAVSEGILLIPIQAPQQKLSVIYGEKLYDLSFEISDFFYIHSYRGTFFVSSSLDKKILFVRDIRAFLDDKNAEVFSDVAKLKGAIFSDKEGKIGIALPSSHDILILPDAVSYAIKSEGIELFEVSDFSEPFLFVPARSENKDDGLLAINSSCILGGMNTNEDAVCEWFLSITGLDLISIKRLRVFSFEPPNFKVRFFIFTISDNLKYNGAEAGGLISIWIWDEKSFHHISSEGLLPSPFYEVVDFSVNYIGDEVRDEKRRADKGEINDDKDENPFDKDKSNDVNFTDVVSSDVEDESNKIWFDDINKEDINKKIYVRVIKRWRGGESKLSYFEFMDGKWGDEIKFEF